MVTVAHLPNRPNPPMPTPDDAQKYRWPERGDRLLRKSQDWQHGGEFSNHVRARHVHIWDGYMEAGAALASTCHADNNTRHSLIYPILFNYRHACELAMKWIITVYGHYASVRVPDLGHHNLWALWRLCKQIILEVGSDDDSIPVVEQIIKDFHDLDRSGQTFRYATTRDGNLLELPDYKMDVPNIRDVMDGVAHFFDGADGQLDAHSSAAG